MKLTLLLLRDSWYIFCFPEACAKTAACKEGIEELARLGLEKLSVFVCVEKPYWRCHRRFIAHALIKKEGAVSHIIENGKAMKGRKRSPS